MKFSRLRIHGFKSFVDGTELHIGDGLTGIVGPNGCGKSNLVEALRWVMGESSYKSMRASGMDDVIFSGSGNRPARNTAEVTVVLDNDARQAPAQFNSADQLEVTRRIEREAGSAYRVNGKDVRAKDVQLLFADASTGSRSPSLVRQGQVGVMINAKPEQRRRLLEEAAGISGLYSRRHEAELRLRGTETNLERLDDVIGQIEIQLQSLKRQSRQASRYKKISAEIAKAQALLLHVKWMGARDAAQAAEKSLNEATMLTAECAKVSTAASRERAIAAAAMPELRETEAERGAAMHRLNLKRENLDQDLERATQRMAEIKARIEQLNQDLAREKSLREETGESGTKLGEEAAELTRQNEGAETARAAAREEVETARAALETAERELSALLDKSAQIRAQRNQHESSLSALQARLERSRTQLGEVEREIAGLEAGREDSQEVGRLREAVTRAVEAVQRAEQEHGQAEQRRDQAREKEAALREPLINAEKEAERVQTEVKTLVGVLKVEGSDLWPPLVDAVGVEKGYEAALGAALGDDLEAPTDEAAPAHWELIQAAAEDPSLPEGAIPLAGKVRAPDVLARRLAQTGIVEKDQAAALQKRLKPGQRLVSRQGDLWRWDGYTAAAEAPTAAAQRLAQRNRLKELEIEATAARAQVAAARAELETAAAAARGAAERETGCRTAYREAQKLLSDVRDKLSEAEQAANREAARIGALSEAASRLKNDIGEAEAGREEASAALKALGAADAQETDLGELRQRVGEQRAAFAAAQARADGLEREGELRANRLAAIASELEAWTRRREDAGRQIEILEKRLTEAQAEIDKLEGIPAAIEADRRRLLSEISEAEAAHRAACDAVAEGETKLNEADQAGRKADEAHTEAREERARAESRLEASRNRFAEIRGEISDQLGTEPENLLAQAGLEADDALPRAEDTEARLDQLNRERERIGAVNLRAEEEAQEVEEQLATMASEREDLEKAIRKLRHGIGQLNREGRERLLTAFDTINGHFQELFTTLFNGGAAELRLTESDDPLEAGLEIMARPPGKKLQVLSLLSGGEQALTALALIFAMFLTNPAPICVLDEVDAPLDDVNVERFCLLVEEMARTTDTRFLIITHHPLTMSRMDRLFGVTMAERGISQLVSVDLQTAERFREAS